MVLQACEAPLRQMAINAGESPDIIVTNVKSESNDTGYDFQTRTMVSTHNVGIIGSLQGYTMLLSKRVASAAGTLLTTSHAIVDC